MTRLLEQAYKKNYLVPLFLLFVFGLAVFIATSAQAKEDEDCICTMEYDPVCGVDEKTYSNPCFAECEGVEIAYEGKCKQDNEDSDIITSCEKDSECEWVSINCCPENAGAEWKCVNKQETEIECPDNIVCPQVVSPKPEEPCSCIEGECEEEEKKDDDDSDIITSCEKDSECEWVSINCCPENAGAEWKCVNKQETEIKCPDNIVCPQVVSPKPEEPCSCIEGECEEEEKKDDEEEVKEKERRHGLDVALERIKGNAKKLFGGDIDKVLEGVGEEFDKGHDRQHGLLKAYQKVEEARERVRERMGELSQKMEELNEQARNAIDTFVGYGVDENTKGLGLGERAAVVHSFESAFGKLPENEKEIEDMLKISNGRWPEARSENAENRAVERFKEIYNREPNLEDPHDNAAITVMAYGLRQSAENRNLESESRGIEIFRNIFGKVPESTEEWNTMQAITYSGASR